MWDWIKAHGDKLLTFLTAIGVTAQNQPDLVSPTAAKYVTFVLACLALAHTCFFSNPSPNPKP